MKIIVSRSTSNGQRSKKAQNSYSRTEKLRSALTQVLQKIKPRSFACGTGFLAMVDWME